jgi:hypothetical protein
MPDDFIQEIIADIERMKEFSGAEKEELISIVPEAWEQEQ